MQSSAYLTSMIYQICTAAHINYKYAENLCIFENANMQEFSAQLRIQICNGKKLEISYDTEKLKMSNILFTS